MCAPPGWELAQALLRPRSIEVDTDGRVAFVSTGGFQRIGAQVHEGWETDGELGWLLHIIKGDGLPDIASSSIVCVLVELFLLSPVLHCLQAGEGAVPCSVIVTVFNPLNLLLCSPTNVVTY